MKDNVIVYSPWGGGSDLIRNIITLDPKFDYADTNPPAEFLPEPDERFKALVNYYTTLPHEPIRRFYSRYYNNNAIAYWNPQLNTAYECNGSIEEIDKIQSRQQLGNYDLTGIAAKRVNEQLSDGPLLSCKHVFLIPTDIKRITSAYYLANPELTQFSQEQPLQRRQQQALIINRLRNDRLKDLAAGIPSANKYTADTLYTSIGFELVEQIIQELDIDVPVKYIFALHSQWVKLYKDIM